MKLTVLVWRAAPSRTSAGMAVRTRSLPLVYFPFSAASTDSTRQMEFPYFPLHLRKRPFYTVLFGLASGVSSVLGVMDSVWGQSRPEGIRVQRVYCELNLKRRETEESEMWASTPIQGELSVCSRD
jgi:hypothetical protein